MTDIPVTVVTANAAKLSVLHDADYVQMVNTLNSPLYGWSYQRIADAAGVNTKAYWQMVAKGDRPLNSVTRKALRNIDEIRDELPAIPDPVELVAAELIDPDAEMILIGTLDPGDRVRRVLLMADDKVTVYANGTVRAERLETPTAGVDGGELPISAQNVTAPRTASVGANYAPTYRPRLPVALKERIEASGVSVETLIERGLSMEVGNG